MEVQLHSFLTSVVDGNKYPTLHFCWCNAHRLYVCLGLLGVLGVWVVLCVLFLLGVFGVLGVLQTVWTWFVQEKIPLLHLIERRFVDVTAASLVTTPTAIFLLSLSH
jgi:hypothetical protein